jgi:hypothetical protein
MVDRHFQKGVEKLLLVAFGYWTRGNSRGKHF